MNTKNNNIIEKTKEYVEKELYYESSGHDWWHVYRVWKSSKNIASNYINIDNLIIELAALLHDLEDWKENKNNPDAGSLIARKWLSQFDDIEKNQIDEVCNIIKSISFKGDININTELSLEAQIVQDADRLDAMGAIGIARTFAYGGKKGQLMYDPNIPPAIYNSKDDYINNHDKGTALNHFYEKLLLLSDLMNTDYGKQIAEERHKFMLQYLEQFYSEFEGKK